MSDDFDPGREAWIRWRAADEGVDLDQPDDLDEDFEPIDLNVAMTRLLVRGESRDDVAKALHMTRDEVDARIAHATALAEAEAIAEREWIVRERLLDLTRQASSPELSGFETNRLGLLLDLAKLELELIGWTRRRAASA